MRKSKFSETQIVGILKDAESGVPVADLLRTAAEGWRTSFRADRVVLFASHLGGAPPRHDVVTEVSLRG